MKYTIFGFSQQKLIELGLDNNEACILRWLLDFKSTDLMKKVIAYDPEDKKDIEYVWVKYDAIIKDLPILRITNKQVIGRTFLKMVNKKVLKRYVQKVPGGTYTCFAFNPVLLRELLSSTEIPKKEDSKEVPTGLKSPVPPDEKVQCTPDRTVQCHRTKQSTQKINLLPYPSTNSSSTSAEQHTDTHKKEAEEAENGIIKKIQEVFGENVFDSRLYTHIKTITESQEQAEEYISWLYEYCVKQKPDSLIGLFYTLAQKPYMFNRFLAEKQVPEKQTKQKLEYHCPVCGESYTAKEDYCSHCQFDLAFTDNEAEIAIHQKMFYYLPAGQREQFLEDKRQLTLEILRSGNYSTAQDKIEALLEKYGITESQEAICQ